MATLADLEKQTKPPHMQVDNGSPATSLDMPPFDVGDTGEKQVVAIRENNTILRALAKLERRLDRLMNFEAMGVERIPEDKRHPPQKLNVSELYYSQFEKSLGGGRWKGDELERIPRKMSLTMHDR